MEFNPLYAIIAFALVALIVVLKTRKTNTSTPGGKVVDPANPNNWEIGPVIDGENYSVNMPLHPVAHPDGFAIEFKGPDVNSGHAHYVTIPTGSLTGKKKVKMTFRFEAEPGVVLAPVKSPSSPPIITLYFERNNLKWTEAYEAWRWYASGKSLSPITVGDHTIEADLTSDRWTAVLSSSSITNPSEYQASIADAGRIGFVLGGGDGLGHGLFATGPARLVITSFIVE